MGRLIEIQDALECPASLTVTAGDLLQFSATGGHIESGAGIVEMLGPLVSAVLANNGEPIAPMGAPNVVFFLARCPGRAVIDVVTGDPWQAPRTTTLTIEVKEPA